MLKNFARSLIVVFALGSVGSALALPGDPSIDQIFQAARTGHVDQAQQMMNQVLRNNPNSPKAHYVAAELYAREGDFPAAREQLSRAETLAPGLPFANAQSVEQLKRELAQG